ncbi:MAG: hypothetical protein ACYSVY_15755 [Planctomycetota bacterium]|jgi:hypothetical protein
MHSELPWTAELTKQILPKQPDTDERPNPRYEIMSWDDGDEHGTGTVVAEICTHPSNPAAEADADLIVRAVNSHEALLAVAQRMLGISGPGECNCGLYDAGEVCPECELRAAIIRAVDPLPECICCGNDIGGCCPDPCELGIRQAECKACQYCGHRECDPECCEMCFADDLAIRGDVDD